MRMTRFIKSLRRAPARGRPYNDTTAVDERTHFGIIVRASPCGRPSETPFVATARLPLSTATLPLSTARLPLAIGRLPLLATGRLPLLATGRLPLLATGRLPLSTARLPLVATGRLPLSTGRLPLSTGRLPLFITRRLPLVVTRVLPLVVLCVVLLLLPAFLLATPAYADGGAPNLAYVSGTSSGISVIDIQQQKVTTTFSMPGNPQTIYLSLDGRYLYVTQPAYNRVTMLAAKTGQTICTVNSPGQPSLLAYDPSANTLYTAGNGSPIVTEFNPTTCAVIRTITADGPVYGLAVANISSSSTGNQLWVAASTLEVFNNTGRIASIPVPGGPQYVNIPAGTSAYVTTHAGQVFAASLATLQLLQPALLSGGQYGMMDYDAYTGQVYVPDMLHKQVDVLAPIVSGSPPYPHEPIHVISTGAAPQAIAITSDGQFGFIALQGGHVAILDVPGKAIYNTIYVGGDPRFIITGLYPPSLLTTPQQVATWGTVINIAAYVFVALLLIVPIVFIWGKLRPKPAPTNAEDAGTADEITSGSKGNHKRAPLP
jgi:hypothetical protein